MKVTPTLKKIAANYAQEVVSGDLERLRAQVDAYDRAYEPSDFTPEIVAQDRKDLMAVLERSFNERETRICFDQVQKNILEYAKTLPEPRLPSPPKEPSNVTTSVWLCKPWYHHLPVWNWDPIDYQETERRAHRFVQERQARWEKEQEDHSKKVVSIYMDALGLK